jgi:ABC-type uncharacterized transport system, permease component
MKNVASILEKPVVSTIISIFLGFVVAFLILFAAGYNSLDAVCTFFNAIFSKPKFITNVIIKSSPLILTGLSAAFAFKTGLFNIGAEGQYIVATVASTLVGLIFNFNPIIQIPLVILSGVMAGAALGGIVGYLKAKFGIHEVITSIMFNWVSLYLCNYVANSEAFHKPESNGTYPINKSGISMLFYDWKFSEQGRKFLKNNPFLNEVLLKTDLGLNFLIAVIVAIMIWVIIYKTTLGFELRAVGLNHHAALNAGIKVRRNIVFSMLVAGALSGLAGALTISGTSNNSVQILSVFENNGFNGLAVALIARSSPLGCIFAGLIFSALIYAGQALQFKIGIPSEIINIVIGVIVFFIAITRIFPIIVEGICARRRSGNVK